MTEGSIVLSVVVPAKDAAATLPAQLDALLAQEWSEPWELVVVDDGSTDTTIAIVDEYARRDSRVRRVDAGGRGVAHARNVGLAAARGRSVAMCDADDVVGPGWLRAMGDALREACLVTGPLDVDALNPPWVRETRGRAIERGPGDYGGQFAFAHSCNLGVRREVALDAGGFDASLGAGEDVEFSHRLQRAGVELVYVPGAVVRYRYRTTLGGLWRQARGYGHVKPLVARRLRAAGVVAPGGIRLRPWGWLVRNLPALRSPEGRARWVWTAGGCVGELSATVRAALRVGDR